MRFSMSSLAKKKKKKEEYGQAARVVVSIPLTIPVSISSRWSIAILALRRVYPSPPTPRSIPSTHDRHSLCDSACANPFSPFSPLSFSRSLSTSFSLRLFPPPSSPPPPPRVSSPHHRERTLSEGTCPLENGRLYHGSSGSRLWRERQC